MTEETRDQEGSPEEKEEGAQPAAEAAEEAGSATGERVGAEPVSVLTVVKTCIALLDGHAWQAMGLRPDPLTGATAKDLEQARIAIDSIAVLLDRIQAHLREPEVRELTTLLTNLRLNIVRQQ